MFFSCKLFCWGRWTFSQYALVGLGQLPVNYFLSFQNFFRFLLRKTILFTSQKKCLYLLLPERSFAIFSFYSRVLYFCCIEISFVEAVAVDVSIIFSLVNFLKWCILRSNVNCMYVSTTIYHCFLKLLSHYWRTKFLLSHRLKNLKEIKLGKIYAKKIFPKSLK